VEPRLKKLEGSKSDRSLTSERQATFKGKFREENTFKNAKGVFDGRRISNATKMVMTIMIPKKNSLKSLSFR